MEAWASGQYDSVWARNRALSRLVREYPERYAEMLAEEKAAIAAGYAEQDLAEARAALAGVCGEQDAETWLGTPLDALAGRTPLEAMAEGRTSQVFRLIRQMESDALADNTREGRDG